MGTYSVALMPGDGIGPEITKACMTVLDAIQEKFAVKLEIKEVEAGDRCFEARGLPLPDDTVDIIKKSVVCLKAPVGETGRDVIVKLRHMFDLYANIRPIKAYPGTPSLRSDIDFILVRENTEDLYKGIEFDLGETTLAVRVITRNACRRIAEYAFGLAEKRPKRRVTAVHKRNVMTITDGLFSKTCQEVARQHPRIKFDELYVDAAAMNLIRNPQEFDVVVTTNMFGDILSDEAAMVVGGLGMAPSANIGKDFALFEPAHGSAPDIAGKGIANPCSMILSSRMMFEWLSARHTDVSCAKAAQSLESAVIQTLTEGVRTPDLGGNARTNEIGSEIAHRILSG